MNSTRAAISPDEIVLVTAADDGYAVPLAVTIRSALDRLALGRRMRLFILDGGLARKLNHGCCGRGWTRV